MSKTFTAPFAQTQKTNSIVTTDTASHLIATAGPEGALLTAISAIPLGTVTATNLQLLLSKDGGETEQLLRAITLEAYSYSGTKSPEHADFPGVSQENPLRLEAGDQLYIRSSLTLSSGVAFYAEWTDY